MGQFGGFLIFLRLEGGYGFIVPDIKERVPLVSGENNKSLSTRFPYIICVSV